MPSLTIENYVKTIYQVCVQQDHRPAATGQLAACLGVSPSTVTSMLKTLSEGGLAAYTPYEGVRLSEAGRALALRVLRRHRLIELFLSRTLDLAWDEVHQEAENMEHAVSDRLIDRIDAFLGYPATDPHGDPIPKADGTVEVPHSRSLANWKVGQPFKLVRVLDQSPEFLRYLSERGLEIGTIGSVVDSSPEASVVTVQVEDTETTLSRDVAERLLATVSG